VSIALTNACDLACSHCFAPKTRAALDFTSITSWLVELDSNGTFGVGFGGGEPTLYPRFAELCAYVANKTRVAVTFTTHGHHLDESRLADLKGNVHFIRVSMDGVDSTYESIRGRSFSALLGRLDAVRELSAFGINFVINSRTISDLDTAITLAAGTGYAEGRRY